MVIRKINPAAPLVALIPLAVLIWLGAASLNYHSFVIDVPLAIGGLKSDLAVTENLSTISAIIRAKNLTYYRLVRSSQLKATLDLNMIQTPGNYNVKPQIILDAKDAWLVSYTPEIIPISVVPAVSVSVGLAVDLQGFPANGYALGDLAVNPATVTMIGPASLVSTINQAYVVVNVNGKQSSFIVKGEPEVRDAAGHKLVNVRFNPSAVNVSVEMVKGEMFKTVGLVPVFSGSLSAGYWISEIQFTPPAVTLRSSVKRLNTVTGVKTTAIDLVGKTADFSDQVGLEIPAGVSLVGENLITVQVKLGVSPFNKQMVLTPKYVNVTPGFKVVSVSPSTVRVTLTGPAEDLNKIDRKNVVLELDLRSTTSGDNTVNIDKNMFRVPEKISVLSFDPPTFQVTLTKVD